MAMIKLSAPGKLFLSGEWAVLRVGNPGLVSAVNKRVFVEVEESDGISITIDDFNIKDAEADFDGKGLEWKSGVSEEHRERLIFVKGAIETALQYLGDYRDFRLHSWGEESQIEVDGVMKKIGFGSSAACVVATIAGILALHGEDVKSRGVKDVIYKLSTIAHYFAQGKVGSAFDVAASTYGGVFIYKRFDPDWLMRQFEENRAVREIVGLEWPGFEVEELEIPEGFELLVGWTKESASTSAMVKQLNEWARDNQEEYQRLYDRIGALVSELIPVWKGRDRQGILELLQQNEALLRELGEKSGVNIETPELRKLSEMANQAGGAGKLSGAGGGDCGIAVCFEPGVAERIKKSWQEAGLYLVDAKTDYDGIRVE